MRKSLLITCFGVGLLCRITGVAPHPTDASSATDQRPITYRLITKIVSRHYTIEVSAGPTEPVYTVMGEDGNPLVDHITLGAMKQANPTLFNSVSSTLAMNDADASLGDLFEPLGN